MGDNWPAVISLWPSSATPCRPPLSCSCSSSSSDRFRGRISIRPSLSLFASIAKTPLMLSSAHLSSAQIGGAILGVWLAHLMFDLPILQVSTKMRWSPGQWLAEGVATFGLVLTRFLCFRDPADPAYRRSGRALYRGRVLVHRVHVICQSGRYHCTRLVGQLCRYRTGRCHAVHRGSIAGRAARGRGLALPVAGEPDSRREGCG